MFSAFLDGVYFRFRPFRPFEGSPLGYLHRQPMRQANDAAPALADAPHPFTKVIGTKAFLYIGLSVLDGEDVFAAEQRKFSVHGKGIFRDGLVIHADRHARSLLRREAHRKDENKTDGEKRKDQKKIAPRIVFFLFHVFYSGKKRLPQRKLPSSRQCTGQTSAQRPQEVHFE